MVYFAWAIANRFEEAFLMQSAAFKHSVFIN